MDTKTEGIPATGFDLGSMGLENFAPYLMNRIMGRYNSALQAEMSQLGLTMPKMRALAVLAVMDGLLIRELSIYAVVEQSTLSRALDTLEADGLVRREVDPDDGRAFRVYLTDSGRDAYARLWPHMFKAHEAMFAGIPEEQRAAFVSTLNTMLRNVRKHNI